VLAHVVAELEAHVPQEFPELDPAIAEMGKAVFG
jgi:hypothetical protein